MTLPTTTNKTGGYNYDERTYWTNRDFKTSGRLFMQHWMWQLQLGYTLHPSIPSSVREKPDLKIADVACGNGAWLLEVGKSTPKTAVLDGYDLSANCFGAKEWLPDNIKLVGGFDALKAGELDPALSGQYDIVHVRAFVSIIKNNNVKPFVDTLKGLLKPGGYLQWEEVNAGKLQAKVPEGSEIQNPASQGLVQLMHSTSPRIGLLFDWMQDIPSLLKGEGLSVISYENVEWRPEFQKVWNDNLLTVYEELDINFPLAKDAPPNFPMTRETYQHMFKGTTLECAKGVWLYQPGWTVLAQRTG